MMAAPGDPVTAGERAVVVDVAGLALLVEAEAAADLALVHRLVGTRPANRTPDATLRIGGSAPRMPDRPPDFEGPYGDHWDDGPRHHFWHHWGLGATIDAKTAVLGGPAAHHARWVAVRNSMLFVLSRLFYERGRFVLHGAALRRGTTCLLVVGDSGTGKSTLAFAASRAGWHVLADDMVVVEARPDGAIVQGIPRVPSIPGEVARFTATTGDQLPDDDRDRVELVGFDLDVDPAPLTGVVVCDHSEGEGALQKLDPVQAIEALVPAFVLSALPKPVERWFPVAFKIGQGPCVELHHPAEVATRVRAAGPLLSRVCDMCPTGRNEGVTAG